MSLRVYLFGELDGYDGDYYDYDEWTIDTDSYHVKIDLISYYYRDDDYEYYYYVNLSYYMFTDEEYNAEIDKKVEEQGEVDDDL